MFFLLEAKKDEILEDNFNIFRFEDILKLFLRSFEISLIIHIRFIRSCYKNTNWNMTSNFQVGNDL